MKNVVDAIREFVLQSRVNPEDQRLVGDLLFVNSADTFYRRRHYSGDRN